MSNDYIVCDISILVTQSPTYLATLLGTSVKFRSQRAASIGAHSVSWAQLAPLHTSKQDVTSVKIAIRLVVRAKHIRIA